RLPNQSIATGTLIASRLTVQTTGPDGGQGTRWHWSLHCPFPRGRRTPRDRMPRHWEREEGGYGSTRTAQRVSRADQWCHHGWPGLRGAGPQGGARRGSRASGAAGAALYEARGGYLDPATGELLPTWDQALDAIGPDDEPRHVVRFGAKFD